LKKNDAFNYETELTVDGMFFCCRNYCTKMNKH